MALGAVAVGAAVRQRDQRRPREEFADALVRDEVVVDLETPLVGGVDEPLGLARKRPVAGDDERQVREIAARQPHRLGQHVETLAGEDVAEKEQRVGLFGPLLVVVVGEELVGRVRDDLDGGRFTEALCERRALLVAVNDDVIGLGVGDQRVQQLLERRERTRQCRNRGRHLVVGHDERVALVESVALREELDLREEVGGVVDHVRVELPEALQVSIGEQPPEVVPDVEIEVVHVGDGDVHTAEGVDRLDALGEHLVGARLGRLEYDHLRVLCDGVCEFGGVMGQSPFALREDVCDLHTREYVSSDLYPDDGTSVYPPVRNGRSSSDGA